VEDLMKLFNGPFGKFFTNTWEANEVNQLPRVVEEVLTAEEKEKKSLEMTAWVVVAKKA
jgi:hypothetical protein